MKFIIIGFSILCSFEALSNCTGCCSDHGGAVCLSGLTICKDKTPMSIECLESNCNKCDSENTSDLNHKSSKNIEDYPHEFKSYKEAINFLKRVYTKGGRTFFCNKKFRKTSEIAWRHIIPLDRTYGEDIKADPINITPEKKKCINVTKPRKSAKGDLVRIYRYLEDRYKVKLIPNSKSNIFTIWALEDPINTTECQRVLNHGNGKITGTYKELCKKVK